MEFYIKRPRSHFGTGRNASRVKGTAPLAHTQKPDVDNLVKAVMDAITNSGLVWLDDAQVISVSASKKWATSETNSTVSNRPKMYLCILGLRNGEVADNSKQHD